MTFFSSDEEIFIHHGHSIFCRLLGSHSLHPWNSRLDESLPLNVISKLGLLDFCSMEAEVTQMFNFVADALLGPEWMIAKRIADYVWAAVCIDSFVLSLLLQGSE